MDIQNHYNSLILKLKKGERGLLTLSAAEIEGIKKHLTNDDPLLKESLCLAEHLHPPTDSLQDPLMILLKSDLNSEMIIFTLNCARVHIIKYSQIAGVRLHFDFLQILKKYLQHPDWEVREWVLRIIDECGSQGIFFKDDLIKMKPQFTFLNQHKKSCDQIITMLLKRWSPNEGR